ncbi:MAG: hypothetical protein ACR2OT_01545 [Parvibaculales bacterium]
MKVESPSADILAQLEELQLDPARPLIISDADEVLLRFMERLDHYLETKGLWIDLSSYALAGNIKSLSTNQPVEVPTLLDDFFNSQTAHIEPTKGAADALARLAQRAQIIVLTNLPLSEKPRRKENLVQHGMDYPVIVGNGLKGPAVAWLDAQIIDAPVFFLDDIPHNIDSAAQHAPDVHRIHFVADPRLGKLIGAAKGADTRIDVWSQAYEWIRTKIDSYDGRTMS